MVDVDVREDDWRRRLTFVSRRKHFAFRLVKSVLTLIEQISPKLKNFLGKYRTGKKIGPTADGLRGSGRPSTGSLAETSFWKSRFSSWRLELSSRDCDSGMFRAKSLKIGSFS